MDGQVVDAKMRIASASRRSVASRRLVASRLLAGLFGLASGCATYEPVPLEPVKELEALSMLTVASLTQATDAEEKDASPAAQENRQLDFTNGVNDAELVAIALRLNPELKAKRLEVGEAQALLITAGLWPNPEVGFSWRSAIGGASGYTADADLLFELLLPGERSAKKDAAHARIDATRAQVVAAEWQLAARVRGQWLTVLTAERLSDLLAREQALREQVLALVGRRREIGEGTELDIATAELELGQIQRDARLARATLESSRRELNALLGLPPTYQLALTDSGKPINAKLLPEVQEQELDRRLLAGRFELRALQASYQESEHELRAAVARQYPHLKLGPDFSHEGPEGDYLGIGVAIPIPLFDRNQGQIAEKRSLRDRRRAEYVSVLHSLRAQAFEKHFELRRARAELDLQERTLVPLVTRARSLFERAFAARDISVLEWASARQRALEAEKGFLDALVRYRRASIELEAALGLTGPEGEKP